MKIKKVIIEGFRAYQTQADGTFDFSTPDGNCANFISIYAPNGFGKTSFYDAVEWALTNNIERFVRDFARLENDNLSKSQNKEKRRQYILRNRSIPESAPSQVTVIADSFEKTKDVPKAKTGSRDFLFRREEPDPGMEEVPGIFLSQEAIDGFLREEKPEARYARFMEHFGDSDETYRANLIALKRELAIVLKETREEQRRLETIISVPINTEIFDSINSTIILLASAGESIPVVSINFNGDDEREMRNAITRRTHELANLASDLQRSVSELEAASSELPAVVTAISNRIAAETAIERLRKRRLALTRHLELRRDVSVLTDTIEREHASSKVLQSLLEKVPTFNDLLTRLTEGSKAKEVAELDFVELKAGIFGIEQRITECKRFIAEVDTSANKLIELREKAPAIFREIEAAHEAIKEKSKHRTDLQKQIEAIFAKVALERNSLMALEALEITEDSFGMVDLTPLFNQGVSPLELQTAILEKRSCKERLVAASTAVDAFESQKNQLMSLIAFGSELVSKSQSNQCPLCAHSHPSHEDLMRSIVSNAALSDLETTVLLNRDSAQRAFDEAGLQIAQLIAEWRQVKANAALSLRNSLTKGDADLCDLKAELQRIDAALKVQTSLMETTKQEVFGLSPTQLAEHLTQNLSDLVRRRTNEESDLKISEALLEQRQQALKAKVQMLKDIDSQILLVRESTVYGEFSNYCTSNAIDLNLIGSFVTDRLHGSKTLSAEAMAKLKSTQNDLSILESLNPDLLNEQMSKIKTEEDQAQTIRLGAEAILSAFLSKITANVPGYQSTWTSGEIADGIGKALAYIRQRLDSTDVLTRSFMLLSNQLQDVMPYIASLSARKDLDQIAVKKCEQEALDARLDDEYRKTIGRLQARIDGFFYTNLINSIYKKIDPHPDFKEVRFACDFPEGDKPCLQVLVSDEQGDVIAPNLYFSAAQINILSLSIFLARALHVKAHGKEVGCIFIDDPIHSMDSINVLSTIDLLRTVSKKFDRQIILSTHDRNFYELLKRKVPEHEYSSKFIELETFGRVQAG